MKPTKCPLAKFDLDGLNEDKRILREEKSECYLPALAIKKGYINDETGRLHTHACFLCPALFTDGGDYIDCDFFSRWWWHHFGGNKKRKDYGIPPPDNGGKLKRQTKKNLDIKISEGDIPLIDSGAVDRNSIIKNWNKFRIKD